MHDRQHGYDCFSRFPRFVKRSRQRPQNTVQVQSHITPDFIEIKYGWTVIAPFNVFPRTFGTVRGLQPSFAVPFSLEFAGIISGRKAKLGRAEVVDRPLQQGRLFRGGIVSVAWWRMPEEEGATQYGEEKP